MSSPPDSDYPFCIFKLLMNYVAQKYVRYEINGVLWDKISYIKNVIWTLTSTKSVMYTFMSLQSVQDIILVNDFICNLKDLLYINAQCHPLQGQLKRSRIFPRGAKLKCIYMLQFVRLKFNNDMFFICIAFNVHLIPVS